MIVEPYDSTYETEQHIGNVRRRLSRIRRELLHRGLDHDASKLQPPEKEVFDAVTPKLAALTYGSDEYKAVLGEMGEALAHHYAHNSHHPEHYPDGVAGMDLLDLMEMFCDWAAASERHANGDFAQSLELSIVRFDISPQLAAILRNTQQHLKW